MTQQDAIDKMMSGANVFLTGEPGAGKTYTLNQFIEQAREAGKRIAVTASTGLNLQWANVTVYFSPTYSYQEFEQSIGRTHRQGQTKKCLYYLFNVRATVDHDIWACLREKRDFNEKLWKADGE